MCKRFLSLAVLGLAIFTVAANRMQSHPAKALPVNSTQTEEKIAIQKFPISRDPKLYEAFPDVALAADGHLVCVFLECTHHGNRAYTRIMQTDSFDRGRTWTPKRPLTEGTGKLDYFYDCPRITRLHDNRLAVSLNRVGRKTNINSASNLLCFSSDNGKTWSTPVEVPIPGIVPDKLLELENGRWIYSVHRSSGQFLCYSDDQGKTWSKEVVVAVSGKFKLCEASILPMGNGVLVAFLRENSCLGYDCKKVISRDNGESWGEVTDFPLPGCHRPVAGFLLDGRIMITYRFMHQATRKGWLGGCVQNFFAAVTDRESVLSEKREDALVRILPIDYDRSPNSDLGYSGWVQFPDGEIYIVQYLVDDAIDRGQIRGYSLLPGAFMLK